MIFSFFQECKNLREVRSLRKLNHPNIIKLKEVIRENNQLYFVFEFMDCNLYELLKEKQRAKPPGFRDKTVRNIMFQVSFDFTSIFLFSAIKFFCSHLIRKVSFKTNLTKVIPLLFHAQQERFD